MSSQDAGSDGPLACGTEVCKDGTVCCLKKVAPFASCVQPADFAYLQCEVPPSMQAPCFSPAECDAGQVCCLNETVASIECLSPVMCPGGGQSGTYHACASDLDCPNQTVGSCQPVPQVPPGPDGKPALLYCSPLFQ
jgi:hypothetical protein